MKHRFHDEGLAKARAAIQTFVSSWAKAGALSGLGVCESKSGLGLGFRFWCL